ncbi:TAXI family TRAP transporter solute-binding subunit [Desulforamulus ferrireducens]|uniref:C4-dicarboxylate ABC transporter substrate-binding protein n=1 Tax=Desulforamulus ferrireducens TaxID=1833852 RepID=A0A1S6J074_9FIRM|nr:TAXI family TRAP transporter solute-binding subunit [Desulforamulus ferrireducens]AQS60431.1 C4-dicarboxylate ABC transporter substrate-binding protein [Desulforamulus ferrireducens]
MKKRTIALVAILAMLAFIVTGCGGSGGGDQEKPAAEKKFFNIATGGTAGVYYPLGGAIAEILNKNVEGANAKVQSTGASVANVNMLAKGEVQIAFIQNDIAYYAANGTEMFKDNKVENMRAVATIYPEIVQLVTLEKSGIKSVADLKGKRVAVGAAGSSVTANAQHVLEAAGLSFEDIDEQYLSFAEAANGLKDGNIDAAFVTAGVPTAAIQDIIAQHKVVVIPVTSEMADKMIEKYPFYTKVVIPADAYKQAQDVETVGVKAMLVVTDQMDEQTAYEITKAIFDNVEDLKTAHAVGQYISKESAKDGLSIPLHPGAEKFFNE